MKQHIVKILETHFITHDVKRFVVERPPGYDFIPGQATEVSINLPEWKDQLRPFTFTSIMEHPFLEFMVKIYKGPGVFIAGGAGITPFISIFRHLYTHKNLHGNKLIYSNKTSEDVIMEEELQKMLDGNFVKIFTRENVVGFRGNRIDRKFLIDNIADFGQNFYLCGPNKFVKNITDLLLDLGATAETVIIEK